MKNLYIKTFGCMMNEYDSKRVAGLLEPLGYKMNDDIENADLIILNTCSIRRNAENKVYSMLGCLKLNKMKNENLIIAVGGCVAQQEGKRILSKNKHVNLVFGTKRILNISNMIEKIERNGGQHVDVGEDAPSDEKSLVKMTDYLKTDTKSVVTIIEGCDNYCAYCIVPYVRGRESSRSATTILDEVRRLADCGMKEVTLLGQNVNSYYDSTNGGLSLSGLIDRVADIEGVERIRFVTSHPKDLSDELIECFSRVDKLCKQIHLPVQSGSNNILKSMNRKYSREEYLSKVDKLKKVCNNISISTDIIVGFPGESRADFEDTLDLMKKVHYDFSYCFKYSPRKGTKAAELIDDVRKDEKESRLSELQSIQNELSVSKNRALVGLSMDVLVEGTSRTDSSKLTGRTGCNRIVNFVGGKELVGKIVSVKIKKAFINSLRGGF